MTERQPYTVVKKFPDFEIRTYPDYTLAQVDARGSFMEAGNKAFYPLVRYISGNNASAQKISMTSPVIQSSKGSEEHVVSFVLPSDIDISQAPVPRDAQVQLSQIPGHTAAVRAFSGSWNMKRFRENADKLIDSVRAAGLAPAGDVYFARFDPPWKPGFLKHNEALVLLRENEGRSASLNAPVNA